MIAWSREESKKLIPAFIQTYNVDTSLLVKPVEEFASLNEFFYRDIDVERHRPLKAEEEGTGLRLLSSMADSHIMVFHPWSKLRGLVVKNKIFTVESFLGADASKVEPLGGGMEGGEFLTCFGFSFSGNIDVYLCCFLKVQRERKYIGID